MNADEFAYWLQGFFELSESNQLTDKQVEIIKNHLQLVFEKVTPDATVEDSKKNRRRFHPQSQELDSDLEKGGRSNPFSDKDADKVFQDILKRLKANPNPHPRIHYPGIDSRKYC